MKRTFLYSKIHRVTVTDADLHYEGSVTIDRELMDAAGFGLHERVEIWDVTNGARLATYVIEGERGSGIIQINGAAAHLVHKGDVVIIAAYCDLEPHEIAGHQPTVVLVGEGNRIKSLNGVATEPALA